MALYSPQGAPYHKTLPFLYSPAMLHLYQLVELDSGDFPSNSGARFLTGGVFECDISHRRSVAVLCMLYKIRCNPVALSKLLKCEGGEGGGWRDIAICGSSLTAHFNFKNRCWLLSAMPI